MRAADPRIRYNLLTLPSSAEAQATLQTEAGFFWEQNPLREGLKEISQVHGITIWIDRRLDPSQPVTLTPRATEEDATLQSRLRKIAQLIGAEVGLVENVVYFGPRGIPGRLQRAAVELHDATSQLADGSNAVLRDFKWDAIATPEDLLKQIQSQWHVIVLGDLPHDLFHAGEFVRPATLATQLTVLLGGFDLQAEYRNRSLLALKPLETNPRWQASYARTQLDTSRLRTLQAEYAGSMVTSRGATNLVAGESNFHLPSPAPQRRTAHAMQSDARRWSFKVENAPVEAVLEKLAVSIGFELRWNAQCSVEHRQKLVTFSVEQAAFAQLLEAIANASSLTISQQDDQVFIAP